LSARVSLIVFVNCLGVFNTSALLSIATVFFSIDIVPVKGYGGGGGGGGGGGVMNSIK